MNKTTLQVSGMTCSACSLGLEKYIKKQKHIIDVEVNLILQTVAITYERPLTKKDLMRFVKEAGFSCDAKKNKSLSWKAFFFFLFLGLFLMYISMGHMFHFPIPDFINKETHPLNYALFLFIATIPFLFYGKDILQSGIKNLLHKTSNMDTLITFGVIVNFLYSLSELVSLYKGNIASVNNLYFESSAFILLFVKLGRLIDTENKSKAVDSLQNLVTMTPKEGRIIKKEKEYIIPINEINVHDHVMVKPGEVFPVDGIVIDGKSHVNEAFLTGESLPVLKEKTSEVLAGSMNLEGVLTYEALKVGKDSMISHITKLVMNAFTKKTSLEKNVDKISRFFVPFIITMASIFFVFHLAFHDLETAIASFVTTLVVACPCALGLATSLALVVTIGNLSKKGIFVKNSEALENLPKIKNILLDKTGTITTGEISLVHSHVKKDEALTYLCSLEKNSTHPIGVALQKESRPVVTVKNFKNHPGFGIEGKIGNTVYYAGSTKFLKTFALKNPYTKEEKDYLAKGYMIVYLFSKKEVLGLFALRDTLKKDIVKTLDNLQKDYQLCMITGDNEVTAKVIASEVHISKVFAEVTPEEKEELVINHAPALMIGDGINDAPALKAATVGVSVFGGSDVSADSSDIVFLKEDITLLQTLFHVSKKTIKIIKENLFWAFFYNLIMIPLASGFLPITLNPMIASLAMTFSSITVALNSLRLRK